MALDKKKKIGLALMMGVATAGIGIATSVASGSKAPKQVKFLAETKRINLSAYDNRVQVATGDVRYRGGGQGMEPQQEQGLEATSYLELTDEQAQQQLQAFVNSPDIDTIPLPPSAQSAKPSAGRSQRTAATPNKKQVAQQQAPLRSTTKPKQGLHISFDEGSEGGSTDESSSVNSREVKFRAQVFSNASVADEAMVEVQLLEPITVNGCALRKNTVVTAQATRSGSRILFSILGVNACGQLVSCRFEGYGENGVRGLFLSDEQTNAQAGGSAAGSAFGNEAASLAESVLSAELGVAGRAISSGIQGARRSVQEQRATPILEGTKLIFKGKY